MSDVIFQQPICEMLNFKGTATARVLTSVEEDKGVCEVLITHQDYLRIGGRESFINHHQIRVNADKLQDMIDSLESAKTALAEHKIMKAKE